VWANGQSLDLGTLGNLPNGESAGNAINDLGQVAGFSSGDGFPSHAALFTNGTIVDLGTVPANDPFATSVAMDIDGRGWVVGTSDDGGGTTYALLWDGRKLHDLDLLLDASSAVAWQLVSAQALNKLGQVTGMAISRTDGSMHVYLAVPNN
jgi:probable HAF family extracellular repeat protein